MARPFAKGRKSDICSGLSIGVKGEFRKFDACNFLKLLRPLFGPMPSLKRNREEEFKKYLFLSERPYQISVDNAKKLWVWMVSSPYPLKIFILNHYHCIFASTQSQI